MRRLVTIAAVCLVVALSGSANSAVQQDYDSCSQTADLDRSMSACTRIIDDHTESVVDRVRAYLQRGNVYAIVDKADSAIADYSEAINLDPQNVFAYSSRAIAFFRRKDPDHAIADFRQAKSIDPAQVGAMVSTNAEFREISAATAQADRQSTDLAQAIRRELNRVGCEPGINEAGWNTDAKEALREFVRVTKLDLPTDSPTQDALSVLQRQQGRVCPLKCLSGEREVGGRCIASALQDKERAPKLKTKKQASGAVREKRASGSNVGACSSIKGIAATLAATPAGRALSGC
jgi:tetratricopeptide (TPR) repeat protein